MRQPVCSQSLLVYANPDLDQQGHKRKKCRDCCGSCAAIFERVFEKSAHIRQMIQGIERPSKHYCGGDQGYYAKFPHWQFPP